MGFGIGQQAVTLSLKYPGWKKDEFTIKKVEVGAPWPDGVVKIFIPETLESSFRVTARAAMERWNDCIEEYWGRPYVRFEEVRAKGKGIAVLNNNSSAADIGYYATMPAPTVGVSKEHDASLPHELGHTLGLAHEHERLDADKKIAKSFSNKFGMEVYLNQQSVAVQKFTTYGTSFDKYSIMMYNAQAQAIIQDTRNKRLGHVGGCHITKQQVWTKAWNPSTGDLEMIGKIYGIQDLFGLS